MLRLENIVKNYYTATETVAALRGVSLSFRRNEFVSILGPSGCGKTTLLNIVGGLDRYTGGNLYIGGRPTAEFTDRDWDVYRNHRVGFIFQSYNLIPHQTILQNVELALTIAGMAREERVRRAKETLDRVGLAGMYHKRPNQLSGGQCQRVAIARALVNDPEILLADEPTGALDTVTSGQIMDLIREIAGERLVIMVTHNPELAEQYSTRIVRLLDGEVIEDTNPMSAEEEIAECREIAEADAAREAAEDAALVAQGATPRALKKAQKRRRERAKMSFFTAFRLSARNLLSKRRRTALVGFAGSIGIIGIALVLAISAGIRGYVTSMQDDMLSGNPITITKKTYDLSALTGMMAVEEVGLPDRIPDRVYVNSLIEYFSKTSATVEEMLINNDLTKEYTDYVLSMPKDHYAAIQVDYGIDLAPSLYTSRTLLDGAKETISVTALTSVYTSMIEKTKFKDVASYATSLGQLMAEMPDNPDYILSQYDVLAGEIATGADEVMLVLSENTELTDIVLAKLGYYTEAEFLNLLYGATGNPLHTDDLRRSEFSFEEMLGKEMVFYPNDAIYEKRVLTAEDLPESLRPMAAMILPALNEALDGKMYNYAATKDDIKEEKLADGMTVRVVGVLRPKEDISFGCLSSGLYYTKALSEYARDVNYDSEIVSALRDSGESSLYSGIYKYPLEKLGPNMYLPIELGVAYDYAYVDPNNADVRIEADGYLGSSPYESMDLGTLLAILNSNKDKDGEETEGEGDAPATDEKFDPKELMSLLSLSIASLGGAETPESFTIYPTTFEEKDLVTGWLDGWNEEGDITIGDRTIAKADRTDVIYTDTLSLVIAMINSMIDVVSTALICFTSVSLLVSTVMIGILTHVSVVERTKEIGVIRSLGGRKKDVRALFNAETFIIGFLAGLIGILVTMALSLLLNFLIKVLADVSVTAYLPLGDAITMMLLSVGLTLISGLIPASAAARRDPVNALRSE